MPKKSITWLELVKEMHKKEKNFGEAMKSLRHGWIPSCYLYTRGKWPAIFGTIGAVSFFSTSLPRSTRSSSTEPYEICRTNLCPKHKSDSDQYMDPLTVYL